MRGTKIIIKLSFMALVLSMLSGCVFKDQKIEVEYESDNIKAHQIGIVCLNKFSDNRRVKQRIGVVKNGYGMETANVLTDQDITIVISKAIKKELNNLGYEVKLINVDFGEGIKSYQGCDVVDGSIKNFFVEPIMKFTEIEDRAIITVDILVQTEAGKEFKKTYSANGKSFSNLGVTARLAKEAMDKALQNIILDIKADIPKIMEQ